MDNHQIENLLKEIAAGNKTVAEGMEQLRDFPQEALGNYAVIDSHRFSRSYFWAGKNRRTNYRNLQPSASAKP